MPISLLQTLFNLGKSIKTVRLREKIRPKSRLEVENLERRELPTASTLPTLPTTTSLVHTDATTNSYPPPAPYALPSSSFEIPNSPSFRVNHQGLLISHSAFGWYYSPTSIAHYVEALYNDWVQLPSAQQASSPLLTKMQINATWLDKNMYSFRNAAGQSVYYYPFPIPYPLFGMPVSWRSALTASNAMVALTQAGIALNNPQYTHDALKLLSGFDTSTTEGGYRIDMSAQYGPHTAWFEEYAYPNSVTPQVLNGHMFTLENLRWMTLYTHNRTTARLFQEGINALYNRIALYDDSPISAYDLLRRGHLLNYGKIHIELLNDLYQDTRIKLFHYYAVKWAAGITSITKTKT